MLLGQIVTKTSLKPLKFFGKTGEIPASFEIPTLIVGKKNAEEHFGKENIKVLNRKIGDNLWWTFSKTEKRVLYEEDIENFYKETLKEITKKIKYTYFNIFMEKLSVIKRFIAFMYSDRKKYIYFNSSHLYIYVDNTVIGFNLRDTEYIGIPSDKIIRKIKSNPSNILFTDDDFVPLKIKNYIPNSQYLAPYLYFLSIQ